MFRCSFAGRFFASTPLATVQLEAFHVSPRATVLGKRSVGCVAPAACVWTQPGRCLCAFVVLLRLPLPLWLLLSTPFFFFFFQVMCHLPNIVPSIRGRQVHLTRILFEPEP